LDSPSLRICLFDRFVFKDGGRSHTVPDGCQRLLALLALKGRMVRRSVVAGTLWPAATEEHAFASLRSTLARLRGAARAAVVASGREVGLSDQVRVDLRASRALAYRLMERAEPAATEEPGAEAIRALSGELLPDWDDEWVLLEAEAWRQLRLRALEALAVRLIADEEYGEAAAAALAAVRAEPLRESPRALLMRVHLAEGNHSEAIREFALYRELLKVELGVEPTDRLRALVPGLESATRR
jgi:DNA-binding SARP family transcriptional activator